MYTAEWTEVPLRSILTEAGLGARALNVAFRGIDRGIGAMTAAPRAPRHGFLVRLIGPAGTEWRAKVAPIEVITAPFTGYHQIRNYLYRQSENDPGTRSRFSGSVP